MEEERMKKTLSLLLAVIIIIGLVPLGTISAFAANPATVKVESVSAIPDSTVDVAISITDNPGIASMGFTLSFDESLTLVGATNGEAFSELTMTPPAQLKKTGSVTGSCRFAWLGSDNVTEDGVILNLKFKVSNDAELNKNCVIFIACEKDDVLDENRTAVPVTTQNGKVTIISYTPGDVDGNSTINMLDVLTLCQFYVDGCQYDPNGYAVNINPESGDVDANGKVNMLDVLMICQYYVDGCKYDPNGYGVILLPGKKACEHTIHHVNAKETTCTEDGNIEYWYCTKCNDYFADENGNDIITLDYTVIKTKGHNPISVDAVPATTTSSGYTAGVWCDKCETWISGHEIVEPITPDEANIGYRLWYVKGKTKDGTIEIVEDTYLQQQQIINSNPDKYTVGVGVAELKSPSVDGYDFLGWYEYPETDAKRIYSIPSTSKGDIVVYAVWSKHEYTITYLPDSAGSTLQKIAEEKFTVDKETALQVPSWPNLVWVGWSDESGNVVKSIPKGTAHDVSLTANWMSKRNQTVPNTKYSSGTPAISKIENDKDLYYAFTYEIGDIQNVPIQQVEDGIDGKGFNLVKGQTYSISKTFTQKISQGEATNVANTVSNATTKSDSWTLSEDWNKSTTFSQEHSNEVSEEQSSKAAMSLSQTDKYSLSSGIGGSKEHIDEKGNSTKVTKKDEFGVSVNVGTKSSLGANVGLGDGVGINAGKEYSANLGLDYKHSKETTTEDYEKHTDKTSTNWNINKGFETSQSMSASQEFSQSISQSIRDTYKYGETLDYGGSNSQTVSSSNTSSESRQYSSSVTYSTESGSELTVNEVLTGDAETGFYRKVLAANFKVFAVVIYDVKSGTFSTMTYSLKINDSEHLFTDYSTVSSFDDYENGVLSFEVPIFVGDYIYSVVGASDGLKIDPETGIVQNYGYIDQKTGICYKKYNQVTGEYSEPCDTDVIIPQYVVLNNKIVKIKGIAANVFSGTNITTVYLNTGIIETPNGAFEGCTSLRYITGAEISSIGKNAFKGCSSLYEMCLSDKVVHLGEGALDGVDALTIYASSPALVEAAMKSGVKHLTIDLSRMSGEIDDTLLKTPDSMTYFALIGGGNSYDNLTIESSAETTEISNITINNKKDIPLKLSSENISISYSSITSSGFVMRLETDTANIVLDGNNYFYTDSNNVALCKNINLFEKEDSLAIGRLRVNGNILICGTTTGTQYAEFDSDEHKFVYITDEMYENYFNTIKVAFDANGGNCAIQNKDVYMGSAIGELPVPKRDYYTFNGWFTEKQGGEKVSEQKVFDAGNNITLYAQWTENPLSGWIKATDMPSNAGVVNEKWTLNVVTTKTASSVKESNWTLTNTTSKWGDYGSWSSWSKTSATASDSRQVEKKTVTDQAAYTNYRYYIYRTPDGYGYGTNGYNTGSHGVCSKYDEINLSYQLPLNNSSLGTYGPYDSSMFSHAYDCYWFYGGSSSVAAKTHTEYRYRDRSLVYTYSFESSSDPTGNSNATNIVKYVQYRVK